MSAHDRRHEPRLFQRPATRLRVWGPGAGPGPFRTAAGGLAVEWAARVAHPTSYGLLGAHLTDEPVDVVVADEPGKFENSLAGSGDLVEFGLPREYHEATRTALVEVLSDKRGCRVDFAAHGRRSSPVGFYQLATFLAKTLLTDGTPNLDEAAVWERWIESVRAAVSWAERQRKPGLGTST